MKPLMTLSERQKAIVDEFAEASTWEDRYRKIITLGQSLPALSDDAKQDKYKVKGCQSQVWLLANLDDKGHIIFQADSDAMIVRGLVALLLRVYSDASPDEIIASPPDFINELGLSGHLTPSRTNGLYAMVQQIMYYATALKALASLRTRT